MDVSPVNVADIVILLVVVISGVFAFFRGFVHELLAVVSWIGAALATLYGFPHAQPYARDLITIPLIADISAGVAIFLVVLIALSILTRLLARRVRNSSLGPLDRSLGLLFGFLRGGALVCIAWLILAWAMPREDRPEWITEARSLPLVEQGSAILVSLIPARLRGEGDRSLNGVRSDAERLQRAEQSFRDLINPGTKGDAPRDDLGYNPRMRDEMQRAIDGLAGAGAPAE